MEYESEMLAQQALMSLPAYQLTETHFLAIVFAKKDDWIVFLSHSVTYGLIFQMILHSV
jgi:hypothetical protein